MASGTVDRATLKFLVTVEIPDFDPKIHALPGIFIAVLANSFPGLAETLPSF